MIRKNIQERFQEIRRHHDQGATGEQVMAALTDMTDEAIERVYQAGIQALPPAVRWKFEDGLAVVALGGYGRGERSPYSDIDLMFLHRPSLRGEFQQIAGAMLRDLWDAGFQVGHCTRTVADCIANAKKDLTVRTAMMEARFLCGGRDLFDQFRLRYQRRIVYHRPDLYARAKIRSRVSEYGQYGTTTYLLEPHLKRSRGGLRDIHLLRWLCQCWHQTSSLELLCQQGLLSKQDFRALGEAQEFLWGIRNELHFHAGRSQDTLTFDEQVRIAALRGYRDEGHLLGVERFMQRYFDHTTAIAEITSRHIEGMTSRGLWRRIRNRLTRRRVGDGFLLSGDELSVLPEFRAEVFASGERLLSLFRAAQETGARLSFETQGLLTERMDRWPPDLFSPPETAHQFRAVLSAGKGVTETLRRLHRFRVLEQIMPDLKRVRALMQFNQYHKYTVDEHCLRAVEEAEKIGLDNGPAGEIFHELRCLDVLFLALLSHDLGKGLVAGEHSEQGASIAVETARRLGLDPVVAETYVFLVREHLLMTHVAFRRDLADDGVLLSFAKAVGTPDTLKMLYLLSLADIAAVGPGMLTAWKKDLLFELYNKTLEILTGGTVITAESERIRESRSRLSARLAGIHDPAWLSAQLDAMTSRYLIATPADRIALDLERVARLARDGVEVQARNDPGRHLTEYGVYTFDDITPGIFHKISGVLAAKGLQIVGATITTWSNKVVVDVFEVQDPDFSGLPPPDRLEDVRRTMKEVLLGHMTLEEARAAGTRLRSGATAFPREFPVQIEVDNTVSHKCTIIEVFSPDRPGLLSVIARAFFDLNLSVQTARVATQLDQIVDIFHVTDLAGQKITDSDKIQHLKQALTREIEKYLEASRVS